MNTRVIPLALSLALLVSTAHAESPETPAATTAASVQHPLLWKVSDQDNSVYLLGSFHLLKPTDYPLPKEVDAAFEDAESVLFEVTPEEMASPATVALMQKYMAYEAGNSLSKVLPKPTLDKLGAMVSASGSSLQAVEQSEPWAINLGLMLGVSQALGFKPELGLDKHLMERAAKAGKPTAGLESADDQLKAMDSVPYAEQARELDEFLTDPGKAVQQLKDLHLAWHQGDVVKLEAGIRTEMAEKSPESYRLLNVDRNDHWLPQLEKRLTESRGDDTLVVVGALHLLGKDGVVEKLRAKGYTVERVCEGCVP